MGRDLPVLRARGKVNGLPAIKRPHSAQDPRASTVKEQIKAKPLQQSTNDSNHPGSDCQAKARPAVHQRRVACNLPKWNHKYPPARITIVVYDILSSTTI